MIQPTTDWKLHKGIEFSALDVIVQETADNVIMSGRFRLNDGGMTLHVGATIEMSKKEYVALYGSQKQ